MFFNFCNGGRAATEEAHKETAILEFEGDPNHDEEEILKLLIGTKVEDDENDCSTTPRNNKSFETSMVKPSISDGDSFSHYQPATSKGINWETEIETFSKNMKQIDVDKENVEVPILSKKRSKKKKSLRNNKNKMGVKEPRRLQLRASV
eukprot:scaffold5114_cov67-Cylindrotheca_fusiformis.AAC.15